MEANERSLQEKLWRSLAVILDNIGLRDRADEMEVECSAER